MTPRRQRFKVAFEDHRKDGNVWCVHAGRGKWALTHRVVVNVPCETVYRGPTARQPRAYLVGTGRVYVYADSVVIRP